MFGERVLQNTADNRLHLRAEKCQSLLPSVKYMGFIFHENGQQPDPYNIKAIQQMPVPKDVPMLRSFLGMISYYSAFMSPLHDIREPLNRLLQKDHPWIWSKECDEVVERLKGILGSKKSLTHYDPKLPTIVAADTSDTGVGAVLLYEFPDGTQKAVIHISNSLSTAQR